jgi:mono/diheme cytochrome c family protein
MAEVVARSTQHLHADDLRAVAEYLRTLQAAPGAAAAAAAAPAASPASASVSGPAPPASVAHPRPAAVMQRGARLYEHHCATCHGERGEGTSGIGALAGNRAVLLATPRNVVLAIRHGGFLPTTAGNPRPYGMPPFGHLLGDDDIATLASFVRGAWGNDAPAVQAIDVWRAR